MKKQLIAFLFILILPNLIFCQKKYDIKTIAFYNLENLFDTENDTLIDDEASPIMEIKENRFEIYQKKLHNMVQDSMAAPRHNSLKIRKCAIKT